MDILSPEDQKKFDELVVETALVSIYEDKLREQGLPTLADLERHNECT